MKTDWSLMKDIINEVKGAKSIGLTGHIRPDGDCVGSVLALYNYLCDNTKDIIVDVYLEYVPDNLLWLKNAQKVNVNYDKQMEYDVFIALDCGSIDRIGDANRYFLSAEKTICIDHHISNTSFAQENYVDVSASSTCELLYSFMEEEKIDKDIAEALYAGIIYDTGVFKHSNTTEKTMNVAGRLISKGIDFSRIIDESFYQKTYAQNQLLGRCLTKSFLILDGKCVIASIGKRNLSYYNATSKDLDGVIDHLRVTKGVEVAVFIHEVESREYKVSLRSNGFINVNKIAVFYGGGGHMKAAGCSMKGTLHDVINNLTRLIEAQLKQENLEID